MIALLFVFLPFFIPPQQAEPMNPPVQLAHVANTFRFQLAAPLERAAPLFGPQGERCWGGKHWDPHFLYPQPARDTEGAVFTVQHGPHTSIWVNTEFDLSAGRMQYVSVIDGVVASIVDVHLMAVDPNRTNVEVTYQRTALSADVNEDVQALGNADRDNGPHWRQAIEACLATQTGAAATHP